MDHYIAKLNGRLQALSGAADLVMARRGVSLDLGEIVRTTLGPFMEERSSRIHIEGPALQLGEQTGGPMALALHELATNAIKYGALSTPQGRVTLNWRLEPDPHGRRVEIIWQESGGPECVAPKHAGFGTRVIKFAASHETSNTVVINYLPKGLQCCIRFVNVQGHAAVSAQEPVLENIGIL